MSEKPEPDIHEMAMQYWIAIHGEVDEIEAGLTSRVITTPAAVRTAESIMTKMFSLFGEYRTHQAIDATEDILNMVLPVDDPG